MLVETRVLPTKPPVRVRLHEPVLNAATDCATCAWLGGLSFAMACALWAGVTGVPVDETPGSTHARCEGPGA